MFWSSRWVSGLNICEISLAGWYAGLTVAEHAVVSINTSQHSQSRYVRCCFLKVKKHTTEPTWCCHHVMMNAAIQVLVVRPEGLNMTWDISIRCRQILSIMVSHDSTSGRNLLDWGITWRWRQGHGLANLAAYVPPLPDKDMHWPCYAIRMVERSWP